MKYLKKYKLFENVQSIHDLCKQYGITNYTINDDLSIDVNDNVLLYNSGLTKIPLKFKNVRFNFYCESNQLMSLEGSPQSVMGNFDCYNNQLTSLEGAPQSVGGHFYCYNNQLTSLEGAPQSVGGHFYCHKNQLRSLEGAPQSVGGDFYCQDNPIYSIWQLFVDYSKVELFNDYDPVREIDGKPALVIDRLNMFLEEIGKPTVKKVDGWINI
jgi:hypothetical protein